MIPPSVGPAIKRCPGAADEWPRGMLAKVWKTATGGLFVRPPDGRWTAEDAELAVMAIDTLVNPEESYIFVADLTGMTGYEPPARRMWQEWFDKRKENLIELWVVGPNIHPVIRLGLAAISAFTGRSFRFARSIENITALADPRIPRAASPSTRR
jgi:hypothetical protein